MPLLSFEMDLAMRIFLVSAFFPEVTQQIHSLRASGVMSSHATRAVGAEAMALRKSVGSLCTLSVEVPFFIIKLVRQKKYHSAELVVEFGFCFFEGVFELLQC